MLSLHNVVVHNNFGSGGAIVLREGSALTTTGCLTLSGNMPYNVFDPFNEWTDESTGTCSGAIGNGHAVPQPPSLMTCGFPGPGNLDVSATYQLYADCTLTGRINISEGVEVRVVGNGRVLRSSPTRFDIFLAANSRLRLENIRLDGVRVFSWGELDARQIRVINGRNAILFNMGSASFDNALFEDNVATSAASRSVLLAWNAYQGGFTSIRDSALRNNHGGVGALQIAGATLELHGCVTFENNMPTDYSGAITDNRDPDCDITIVDPTVLVVVARPGPHEDNWHGPKQLPLDCFHKLGAIGLLCRPEGTLEPEVQVWGVTEFGEGHFILRVAQSQADAAPGGSMVTHSPDNRVGVVVWPDRNITFSMGPNHEGKVHHATLPHNLSDYLVEAVTVHGGPPGVPPSPPRRAPRRRSRRGSSLRRRAPTARWCMWCARATRSGRFVSPMAWTCRTCRTSWSATGWAKAAGCSGSARSCASARRTSRKAHRRAARGDGAGVRPCARSMAPAAPAGSRNNARPGGR
ncbi:MAG: hypothetical protein OXP68_05980 [Anaerolineaceae bacterium]|nr:hypothetical protein [Anaerolineaceae bacterium]MDE0327513.1 hypothetical protein [Anaerolineaceae bacterium]